MTGTNKGTFYNYCYGSIKRELGEHIRFLLGETSAYYAQIHQRVINAKNRIKAEGRLVTIEEIMKMTNLSKKIVTRELRIDYTRVSYEKLYDL